MPADEPKLIIDTDWKAQAQAEKAKLAETVKPAAKPAPSVANPTPASPAATGPSSQPGNPAEEPASFDELVRMLAMQALTFLGEIPDPASGQRMFAPEYARRFIDMIGVLEEKTKGNLTKEEDESLKGVGADLRMAYVELSKAVAKAVAEGKIKPRTAGGLEIAQGGMPPMG
jgi:Domain of unknown function (DUF1844)